MIVKNTKENREIQQAVANLAIEEMYLSEDFLEYYMDAREHGVSHEELCKEIVEKYER